MFFISIIAIIVIKLIYLGLVTEIFGPKYRGWIGMGMPMVYGLTYGITAAIAYGIRRFRLLQVATVAHDLVFAVLFWQVTLRVEYFIVVQLHLCFNIAFIIIAAILRNRDPFF